jgi:hypothetical protein
MRPGFIGLAMLALTATAAHPAEDKHLSANEILPGCKALLGEKILSTDFSQGRCAGILIGLVYSARIYGACVPADAPGGQLLRVAVTYIDRQPERWHEDFRLLALEAMKRAWPCKQQ